MRPVLHLALPLLFGFLIGLSAVVLGLGIVSFRLMLRRKPFPPAWIEARSLEKGSLRAEDLALPWEIASIDASGPYKLTLHYIPGKGGGLAVFHHGFRWNWMSSIKYARAFVRAGWSVVAFDARGHGESGGAHPSFGAYEKRDLLAVADWAFPRLRGSEGFIVHGVSLGAAVALQYAPLDPRLDGVIADCPFSSAAAILGHRLRSIHIPRPPAFLVVRLVDLFARCFDGFSLFSAAPERAITETSVPLLLIHGDADDYVPWRMSADMAETRRRLFPHAPTELAIVPGAEHAAAYRTDPVGYENRVMRFVELAVESRRRVSEDER